MRSTFRILPVVVLTALAGIAFWPGAVSPQEADTVIEPRIGLKSEQVLRNDLRQMGFDEVEVVNFERTARVRVRVEGGEGVLQIDRKIGTIEIMEASPAVRRSLTERIPEIHLRRPERDGGGPRCIDFEDLSAGTRYAVGDSLVTGGKTLHVESFVWSDGTRYGNGSARVVQEQSFSGPGNEIFTNNVTVHVEFSSPLPGVRFDYSDRGGNVNLTVNGDFRNADDLRNVQGQPVGGAALRIRSVSSGTDRAELHGRLDELAVGGQEFFLDDICPLGEESRRPDERPGPE